MSTDTTDIRERGPVLRALVKVARMFGTVGNWTEYDARTWYGPDNRYRGAVRFIRVDQSGEYFMTQVIRQTLMDDPAMRENFLPVLMRKLDRKLVDLQTHG
jgi:hypothetical protein